MGEKTHSYADKIFLNQFFNEGFYEINTAKKKPQSYTKSQADEPIKVNEPMPEVPEYTGDFSIKVLIICGNQSGPDITPPEKKFLQKILAAVNIEIQKVAIIQEDQLTDGINSAIDQLQAETCIVFSSTEHANKPYEVVSVKNARLIYADELSSLEKDKPKKAALWNALKKLFSK